MAGRVPAINFILRTEVVDARDSSADALRAFARA